MTKFLVLFFVGLVSFSSLAQADEGGIKSFNDYIEIRYLAGSGGMVGRGLSPVFLRGESISVKNSQTGAIMQANDFFKTLHDEVAAAIQKNGRSELAVPDAAISVLAVSYMDDVVRIACVRGVKTDATQESAAFMKDCNDLHKKAFDYLVGGILQK